jgi:hypothetical protein
MLFSAALLRAALCLFCNPTTESDSRHWKISKILESTPYCIEYMSAAYVLQPKCNSQIKINESNSSLADLVFGL